MNTTTVLKAAAAPLALVFGISTGAPAFAHHDIPKPEVFSCKRDDLKPGMSRVELIEKVLPATVTVNKVAPEIETGFKPTNEPPKEKTRPQGSGFVINDEKGYIVTNAHVVDNDNYIRLSVNAYGEDSFNNLGKEYNVKLIGKDDALDIAILQINDKKAPKFPCLPVSNRDVKRGEDVMAVGMPMGLHFSTTFGTVSGTNRRSIAPGSDPLQDMIQTQVPINPGNSGGVLVNTEGEVVGVNSLIFNGSNNIAFSINARTTLMKVVNEIFKYGDVKRGSLGLTIANATDDDMAKAGLSGENGVMVLSVNEGSSADKAGIRAGDIVLNLGSHRIVDAGNLSFQAASVRPETKVDMTILRSGRKITKEITIAEKKENVASASAPAPRR